MTKKTSHSSRGLTTKLKKAKRFKPSSQNWLRRQLNDPYVAKAKQMGFRSRAAFKLLELQEKYNFIKPGMKVVDLGAAPGGWTQVLCHILKPEIHKGTKIVAMDLLKMDPMNHVDMIEGDFTDPLVQEKILALCPDKLDLVVSDMSPATSGDTKTDHLRIINLVEKAFEFAKITLKPGGHFVAKVFQGGADGDLLADLKRHFNKVKHTKPEASRKDSKESYVIALDFKKQDTL